MTSSENLRVRYSRGGRAPSLTAPTASKHRLACGRAGAAGAVCSAEAAEAGTPRAWARRHPCRWPWPPSLHPQGRGTPCPVPEQRHPRASRRNQTRAASSTASQVWARRHRRDQPQDPPGRALQEARDTLAILTCPCRSAWERSNGKPLAFPEHLRQNMPRSWTLKEVA